MNVIGFDLDGTILDTIPMYKRVRAIALEAVGITPTEENQRFFEGVTTEIGVKKLHLTEEQEQIFLQTFEEEKKRQLHTTIPFPDTKEALEQLAKHAHLVVLSNSYQQTIIQCLEYAGIDPQLFTHIIGADNVSHPKPDIDEFTLAKKLEHHKINFYVGDTPTDVQAGSAAGAKVFIRTGTALNDDLQKAGPYTGIQSFHELKEHILNHKN